MKLVLNQCVSLYSLYQLKNITLQEIGFYKQLTKLTTGPHKGLSVKFSSLSKLPNDVKSTKETSIRPHARE